VGLAEVRAESALTIMHRFHFLSLRQR
jgi:hypothetical protein